jgi:single-strand selective monofunctional uracil DNA glycosylase
MTALRLAELGDRLCQQLAPLPFAPPVAVVYNPLVYARPLWQQYLQRFGEGHGRVLLVGMNPGPWGMAQTGVPFGEVAAVRDWMGLNASILPPAVQHPKVPIEGLQCWRNEVSGQRLWGWARARWGTAEAFFGQFFVLNYCPLCFLEPSGRNRTPDRLPQGERAAVEALCDAALLEAARVLQPRQVIGVGQYAAERAQQALQGTGIAVGRILHPSPASPQANRDWAGQAEAQLRAQGVAVGEMR